MQGDRGLSRKIYCLSGQKSHIYKFRASSFWKEAPLHIALKKSQAGVQFRQIDVKTEFLQYYALKIAHP